MSCHFGRLQLMEWPKAANNFSDSEMEGEIDYAVDLLINAMPFGWSEMISFILGL
jgi:hypothetical protein